MIKPHVVQKALEEIGKRAVNYEYFFERLDSPDWIAPLLDAGFFTNPRPVVRKGDYVSFPIWPESRYLARMARFPEAHELVLGIALKIPPTENARVHEDLADLAANLPPGLSARLVAKALEWLESPYHLLLPEKIGKLIEHLSRGGKPEAALRLARSLFAIFPEPEGTEGSRAGAALFVRPEPRARFDPWLYEQLLKKHLQDLLHANALKAIAILSDLLEAALGGSLGIEPGHEAEDDSYLWRPAIEEHHQNQDRGIKDALVAAIRDGTRKTALETPTSLPQLLNILETRKQSVFHRTALQLLGSIPAPDPQAVATRLIDRKLFQNRACHHEYYLLLEKHFGGLTPEQKSTILGWIEEGPFKTSQESSAGGTERATREWQLHRLMPLRESLSPAWRGRFEALVAEFGTPEHPDFLFYATSWTGPTSPKSTEELGAMNIDDLISYLTTWEPPKGIFEESHEGLGRSLTSLVASDPKRFERVTRRFEGLDPTYVRSVLCGFHDALKQKRPFAWGAVLDLARWAVGQPVEVPSPELRSRDRDPGWGWTRREVASLLSDGFEERSNEIPFNLRNEVWGVLKPLTDDPDPTPEAEARYCLSGLDAANLSINSVRGEAIHAVMRYALWVHRNLKKETGLGERVHRGMDDIPEVKEVLEAHLDTTKDPAKAIRAVYGQWFPVLVKIDHTWASAIAQMLFPVSAHEQPLREAAWDAYLGSRSPSLKVFEILKSEYERAVAQLEPVRPEKPQPTTLETRLAEHLMTLYWWGVLDHREPAGLIRRFYSGATDELRGHAMEFVGRSLRNTAEEIPAAVLDRLRELWQWRLAEADSVGSARKHSEELYAFGWWFVASKFDEDWVLAQLSTLLDSIGKTDPAHLVAERLAEVSRRRPLQAAICLRAMVDGDKEGWAVHGYLEHARGILATALTSESPEAREAATNLVHTLGAKGHLGFRDLLGTRHQ